MTSYSDRRLMAGGHLIAFSGMHKRPRSSSPSTILSSDQDPRLGMSLVLRYFPLRKATTLDTQQLRRPAIFPGSLT